MSEDNLFETFGGDDVFEEEEDGEIRGAPEGEGQNKTFLIAVGILGGLLVIAIAAFIIWALVINPRMQASRISPADVTVEPTEEVIDVIVDEDATATAEALAAAADVPTDTPEPTATPTPVVGPTSTPAPDDTEGEGGADSSTAVDAATEEPRRSPTPTSSPQPTSTPRPTATKSAGTDDRTSSSSTSGASEELSQTGLGEVMLVIAGVLLIGVAFLARRLRSA